ncbi:MAG TPA: MtrB/PioB family decaheme-associated outer membrane protein [Steroidobacteraceae bacterium]|nr:MtrB/PioB family decaheme-associated outer membrane protein [Steroidobacteraceae bacterium]
MEQQRRSHVLALAVVAVLMTAGAAAHAQEAPAAPDTSAWKCSKCPFPKGYAAEAQIGGGYVDDASAKFGDYTGLDEDGGYVVAGAEGGVARESGYRLDYSLQDLGLDSRSAAIEGGKQGAYEFGLSYDRVPHTISDTGQAIFSGIGSPDLTLPGGWVRAGSTAGMTALGTSLHSVDEGYDRDRYGVFGRFLLGDAWSVALDYKRDERSGTRHRYAAFGSAAMELLRPVDDATDRFNASVRYQGAHWFAQLGYYGSIYDSQAEAFRFENPFTAPAGAESGLAALEPDNSYNEFALSTGWYGLPGNTSITLSGAMGQGSQDSGFVGYTINPNVATDALPFANLDGDVSVTRADLTVSARPLDRLRLRGAVAYDERENESRQGAFTSIVHTDLFPIGEDRVNPIYGFERTRAYGMADFDVYDDLSVGIGGEWRQTDRTGTRQEVTSEELLDGYGRAQYRPTGWLGFVVKGGVEERDPDNYDAALGLAEFGQNPLMRKYNQAYRYRAYGELLADVAVGALPVTLGMSVYYGDDSYLQSDLGLVSGLDRRFGIDLNWTVSENIAAYASATHEKIDSKTKNSSVFGLPDWRGDYQDDYETYGAGVTAQFTDKLRLNLDYTFGDGKTRQQIVGASAGSFPPVSSRLSSFKADMTYGMSPRADVVLTWWFESLETSDWQFQAEPAVLPTLLGLGVDPYDYDVNYVTLSLRYRFGAAVPAEEAEEASE